MIVQSGSQRVVATTLDDLSWIVDRCSENPEDVFWFFRELIDHPNVREMMFLETINAFEYWWSNGKCLFRQGGEYHFALFEFHRGEEEWIEAAKRTPLEIALLELAIR